MDPLNPVKLWFLSLIAVFALTEILFQAQIRFIVNNSRIIRLFILAVVVFVMSLLAALFFTPMKVVGVYGDTGRNIGFLNYFFLAIITIYCSVRVSTFNVRVLYWTAFCLSSLLTIYGFLQHFKLDFLKWNSPFNPILLTTGNPDFSASLLGLLSVILVAGIFANFSRFAKSVFAINVVTAVLVIYWTNARQGLVATAVGIGLLLVVIFWQRNMKAALIFAAAEFFVGFIAILGMLQIGPLTRYMYKASINDRGYDWRAAIEMFKHHPFFGVGLDRYSAYFLQYRSEKYPLIYGYTQTVNNAHNVFLEILATAGIFAGIAYLLLLSFVAYRAVIVVRSHSGKVQLLIVGVVAGWAVFVAQSIISIDSLVLSIWGWVLAGSIVGLSYAGPIAEKNELGSKAPKKFNLSPNKGKIGWLKYRFVFLTLTSFVVIFGVILPMYKNETGMLTFATFGSPTNEAGRVAFKAKADEVFRLPLLNPNYKVSIATKLAENNFADDSERYFNAIITQDPRNTNAYSLLSIIYENSNLPRKAIPLRLKLKALDPYGADSLVRLEDDYVRAGVISKASDIKREILSIAPGTDLAKRAEKILPEQMTP